MSSGTSISRIPPGPGSLIATRSMMPSFGCSRMISALPRSASTCGKMVCGGCLNTTQISESRAESFLPVRR